MRFYVCADDQGQTFDCVMTRKEAIDMVHNSGGGQVTMLDVPVNAESIQRLLGNIGGFAKKVNSFKVK